MSVNLNHLTFRKESGPEKIVGVNRVLLDPVSV